MKLVLPQITNWWPNIPVWLTANTWKLVMMILTVGSANASALSLVCAGGGEQSRKRKHPEEEENESSVKRPAV